MESGVTKHDAKIRQVAKEYEAKGYKVLIEPRGKDIPSFIENYKPDLIATSNDDNVIVEVKTHADISKLNILRNIADEIDKQKHWRFELVVTGSKGDNPEISNTYTDLDFSEIKGGIKVAKGLVKKNQYAAAFIICWANLESLARQVLLHEKRKLQNKTPLVLIKTLFSLGHLTRADYDSLEKLFLIRNQVVHGYKAKQLDQKTTLRLISITQKLMDEKRHADDAISGGLDEF
ncbi:MAG TPA: hypothetical protein VD884_18895 [Ohtaekwangia sp.]|nr:hypothetical protein [Ohtaekwangia sp.]